MHDYLTLRLDKILDEMDKKALISLKIPPFEIATAGQIFFDQTDVVTE